MDTTTQILINKPPVSILMLTYNHAAYIRQAIESVLAQTYTHWELTIIDDGSTDGTDEAARHFSDPRIKYIRHAENKGLFARRTESLRYARGTYVAILDGDDVWLSSDKLQKQVAYMEAHAECALVGTFIRLINTAGDTTGSTTYHTDDASIRAHILLRNQFAHSSVLIRKSMLDKIAGYRPTLAEDLELFLQLGCVGTFANIPEYLTAYRTHPHGASANKLAMARAVHRIIQAHKWSYPKRRIALMKSWIRIAHTAIQHHIASDAK